MGTEINIRGKLIDDCEIPISKENYSNYMTSLTTGEKVR